MGDNSKAGAFFLGILGIIGIAILLTRQGKSRDKSPSHQRSYAEPAMEWKLVHPGSLTSTPVYENKEEWEIVRGSDRLIEKIVIHRVVIQNG